VQVRKWNPDGYFEEAKGVRTVAGPGACLRMHGTCFASLTFRLTGTGPGHNSKPATASQRPQREPKRQPKRSQARSARPAAGPGPVAGSVSILPRGASLSLPAPRPSASAAAVAGEGDMMRMIEALVAEGQAASTQLSPGGDLSQLLAQMGAPVDMQALREPDPPSATNKGGNNKKNTKPGKKRQGSGGRGGGGHSSHSAPEPPSATFAWSEFQSAAPDAAQIAAPAFDYDDSDDDTGGAAHVSADGQALLASLMAGGASAQSSSTPPALPQQVTVTPIQTRPHRHHLHAPVDQGAVPTHLELGSAPAAASQPRGPAMGSAAGHTHMSQAQIQAWQAQQYHAHMQQQQRHAHIAYMQQQRMQMGAPPHGAAPQGQPTVPSQQAVPCTAQTQHPPFGATQTNAWGIASAQHQQPRGLAAAQLAADRAEAEAAAACATAPSTGGQKPAPAQRKVPKPAVTSLVPASVAARRRPATASKRPAS